MLKRLKKLVKKLKVQENRFLNLHKNNIIRLLGLAAVVSLAMNYESFMYLKPSKTKDFARTSVKIMNMAKNHGGSGVILESHSHDSIILTNRHVCEAVKEGGLVIQDDKEYLIDSMKESNTHDLCEIRVDADLHIDTKVAENPPQKYSKARISGHPHLLPHVLTEGNFSGRLTIPVMVGVRPCTQMDLDKLQDPISKLMCVLGGVPEVKYFDAQLVTGTILPGSSGSAVFDEDGEIAGLVFASDSRELAYAFIVPQEYVFNFVKGEAPQMDWTPVSHEVPLSNQQ